MVKYLVLLLVAVAVLGLARIRLAGDDIAVWHIDPETVNKSEDPNNFLMRDDGGDVSSPVFGMEAQKLAKVFDDLVLSQPRTERLAGRAEDLWVTYIQRSKWFGFPDYISVRILPVGEAGSALTIYSRARYGRSDLGVNKDRVMAWVSELDENTAVKVRRDRK